MERTTDSDSAPIGFWKQLGEDYRRHDGKLTKPGLHAIWVYRLGHRSLTGPPIVRIALKLVYKPMHWWVRNFYGIELPETTQVGRRFRIGHQSGIVIHHNSIIGDDCMIRQNCTLGAGSGASSDKGPVLGNRVEMGAGAVIIGGVKIGDDVRIGPNAVVMMNVPDRAMVVAPPPRVIPASPAKPSSAQ
ncbi:MAG: serine acetyltransferase [Phycisphaerales bacterium]|nr:serine acetyltransferase [Phycisphaerales bacterium]